MRIDFHGSVLCGARHLKRISQVDMRILFAIKTLAHSVGGAERLAASLASAFAAENPDVHMLTFDAPNDAVFYPLDGRLKRHFVPLKNTKNKTGLADIPDLLGRLRREVLEIRPDVVVAFMHSMFVPLQCALLGTGIKVVLSEHTVPRYYCTRPFEFILLQFFSLFAHSITIISPVIKSLYPYVMRRKMVVLPDPVFSDFQKRSDTAAKVVLSAGRLNEDKDHAVLIDAFALIANEFPQWDLIIYGEGPERSALEHRIRWRGLSFPRVSLPGVTKDMDSAYKNARIFVMPSKYENLGLVTVEAMSHSLPVIGFADCTGTNEVIENSVNGILVKARDAQALSQAIKELIQSQELCDAYGAAGFKKAKDMTMDQVFAQWKNYISRL